MPLEDDTIIAHSWCSYLDCENVIADLDQMTGRDNDVVERAAVYATAKAKTILRARWPNDEWPWSGTPPTEVREMVAVMAVARAVRKRVFSGGSLEIYELLQEDAKQAEKDLNLFAAGTVHLETTGSDLRPMAGTAKAPRGELGFRV